jgi:formate dehydrogenase assembly factor FdhD
MATMKCGRCGSEKVMSNLRIRDRYDAGVGQDLEVEIQGNPDALIFKQAHREALRATVCGECGNVGLSVENPEALWKIYIQEKNS